MCAFNNTGNGFQDSPFRAFRHGRNSLFQVCKTEVLSASLYCERQTVLAYLGNDVIFQ